MSASDLLRSLAWNNAWANHRLLRACAALGPGELLAPRTGFFPSLAATLNHNLTVDWFYVDALERGLAGREPNPSAHAFFDPEVPFAGIEPLRAAQREVDLRLVAVARSLTDDDLARPIRILRRAGPVDERLDRLLLHLFQHQIHHRGQAHGMLSGTSVAPPQLDEFFSSNEAHLRAADLAELGLTEADVHQPGLIRPAGDPPA
jgi:uncharacterized damage-inducible protein DinB